MTLHRPVAPAIVNQTKLAREPAGPLSGSSLLPMLVSGIVLVLVGMIAAVMWS